jgi:hypothetical protein
MSRPNLKILRDAGGVLPKAYKFATTSVGAVNQLSHAARKTKNPRIIRPMISENSNVRLPFADVYPAVLQCCSEISKFDQQMEMFALLLEI